jgi:predicted ATPase
MTQTLAQRIAQQADGNPFYLEELVNYVGSQAVDKIDPNELSSLDLPTSLQGLVLSRLDQLTERPKSLLKVASVIGRVFHASWLGGIYPEIGAAPDITDNLQELNHQKFTVSDPAEGEDAYYFRNMITRSVIYDSLLHKIRTSLHEQIGQFLEATYKDDLDQYLDLLAYHYEHGESEEKKRYYLRRAGEFAQKTYANQAALDYFQKVLPLSIAGEQVEILLQIGEVEKLIGNWDEARKHFQEALSLARSINDKPAVGWSQVAIGEMERMRGNYTQGMVWLERARFVFQEINDQGGLAQVLHYSGTIAAQQGNHELGESLFKQSLSIRRQVGDQVGVANLLNNLSLLAEYQGDINLAIKRQDEALAIRRELGDMRTIAISLGNLGYLLSMHNELPEARNRLEESVKLQRETGDRWYLANVLNNLANVLRQQGYYSEAHWLYAESLEIYQGLGDSWATAYLFEDIARLHHLEGDDQDALVLLSAASTLRETIDAPLPPGDQKTLDELQNMIQDILGPAKTIDFVKAGRSMSTNEAITFALNSILRPEF